MAKLLTELNNKAISDGLIRDKNLAVTYYIATPQKMTIFANAFELERMQVESLMSQRGSV